MMAKSRSVIKLRHLCVLSLALIGCGIWHVNAWAIASDAVTTQPVQPNQPFLLEQDYIPKAADASSQGASFYTKKICPQTTPDPWISYITFTPTLLADSSKNTATQFTNSWGACIRYVNNNFSNYYVAYLTGKRYFTVYFNPYPVGTASDPDSTKYGGQPVWVSTTQSLALNTGITGGYWRTDWKTNQNTGSFAPSYDSTDVQNITAEVWCYPPPTPSGCCYSTNFPAGCGSGPPCTSIGPPADQSVQSTLCIPTGSTPAF